MTFQQLSYLVEVAKTGSINKTSRKFNTPNVHKRPLGFIFLRK